MGDGVMEAMIVMVFLKGLMKYKVRQSAEWGL